MSVIVDDRDRSIDAVPGLGKGDVERLGDIKGRIRLQIDRFIPPIDLIALRVAGGNKGEGDQTNKCQAGGFHRLKYVSFRLS